MQSRYLALLLDPVVWGRLPTPNLLDAVPYGKVHGENTVHAMKLAHPRIVADGQIVSMAQGGKPRSAVILSA